MSRKGSPGVVVPSDRIVARMRERAERLTPAKGLERQLDITRIVRALVEAWAEGMITGRREAEGLELACSACDAGFEEPCKPDCEYNR